MIDLDALSVSVEVVSRRQTVMCQVINCWRPWKISKLWWETFWSTVRIHTIGHEWTSLTDNHIFWKTTDWLMQNQEDVRMALCRQYNYWYWRRTWTGRAIRQETVVTRTHLDAICTMRQIADRIGGEAYQMMQQKANVTKMTAKPKAWEKERTNGHEQNGEDNPCVSTEGKKDAPIECGFPNGCLRTLNSGARSSYNRDGLQTLATVPQCTATSACLLIVRGLLNTVRSDNVGSATRAVPIGYCATWVRVAS